MDEPTAALGPAETAQVRDLVTQLKAEGIGIFLISHDIHDVFDLADRISVMLQGKLVGTVDKDDVTKDEVLAMIIVGKMPGEVSRADIAELHWRGSDVSPLRVRRQSAVRRCSRSASCARSTSGTRSPNSAVEVLDGGQLLAPPLDVDPQQLGHVLGGDVEPARCRWRRASGRRPMGVSTASPACRRGARRSTSARGCSRRSPATGTCRRRPCGTS